MNRELMMKAAIQFKGVWPSDEKFENQKNPRDGVILHTHKISPEYPDEEVGCISLGGDRASTDFYDIVTREQFESFVESLFEGAPADSVPLLWDGVKYIEIPRPARAEPEAPYIPQVGEECEYLFGSGDIFIGSVQAFSGDAIWFKKKDGMFKTFHGKHVFRPLRTEEEIKRDLLASSIVSIFERHEADVSKACMTDLLDLLSE